MDNPHQEYVRAGIRIPSSYQFRLKRVVDEVRGKLSASHQTEGVKERERNDPFGHSAGPLSRGAWSAPKCDGKVPLKDLQFQKLGIDTWICSQVLLRHQNRPK